MTPRWGNCHTASEALYHILGGARAGWTPMRVVLGPQCAHFFLRHRRGIIVDPARLQFKYRGWWKAPRYADAVPCAFPRRPSAKARRLMHRLTWSHDNGLTDRL